MITAYEAAERRFEQERSIIPPMTHVLGAHWRQPDRGNILLDDTHAIVSQADFDALPEYSTTFPTGVYEGKMWKRRERNWLLCWYAASDKPSHCQVDSRILLVI